jgi:hypothetical protein
VDVTILKNMKVNGKDYPIYCGTYKMFQTTNQMMIGIPVKRTSADSAQWLCVGRRQVGKCLPGEILDKSHHLGLGQSFKTSGLQILIYY